MAFWAFEFEFSFSELGGFVGNIGPLHSGRSLIVLSFGVFFYDQESNWLQLKTFQAAQIVRDIFDRYQMWENLEFFLCKIFPLLRKSKKSFFCLIKGTKIEAEFKIWLDRSVKIHQNFPMSFVFPLRWYAFGVLPIPKFAFLV